ncbi:MAG: CRTAC1 family protein [Planctomycetota bacterium]|nr:CRTAC1 family protein [Planctomycetota bacterium]
MKIRSCTRSLSVFAGFAASALAATAANAQTTIDGIRFVDLSAAGTVVLGNINGGIGVIDFDRDGWQDLYISGANTRPKFLFRNVPDASRPGERTFVNVAVGAGLNDADNVSRFSPGVLAADFNGDAWPDLFVNGYDFGNRSSGLIFLNNQDGTFRNATTGSGLRGSFGVVQSAAALDIDLDGDLDVLTFARSGTPFVHLFVNNGDATFALSRSMVDPTLSASGGTSYANAVFDADGDGDQDVALLTTGVGGGPALLENRLNAVGSRTLVNVGSAAGFTHLGVAPMGSAIGDYDADGDMDFSLSNAEQGVYYRNDTAAGGPPRFTRVFPFPGIWAWGIAWLDVDNDGDLDHYQCGSVGRGASYDLLVRNLGNGQYANISDAMNSTLSNSQYAVQVDWDNDGRQEIVSINPFAPGEYVAVYRNESLLSSNWSRVVVRGDAARGVNADGVGAVIRLTAGGQTQLREISVGTSVTSTEDLRQHFGLGAATSVDRVEIVWPRRGSVASRTQTIEGPFPSNQAIEFEAPCQADVDFNGGVDFFDYLEFAQAFSTEDARADVTGDGQVDFFDYLAFADLLTRACD